MKHLFFDLDNTLCESRKTISPQMLQRLNELKKDYDIVVISGAEKERMHLQLEEFFGDYLMAQSGNDTYLWKNTLNDNEKKKILAHIKKIIGNPTRVDLIDDRGCQISLSMVGHHADMKVKKPYDPDGKIRQKILKDIPFVSNKLECRIAGTTCLDYTRKDGTKGKNIERFIQAVDWDKKDCVYFGDKLMKGGNDESVIGVIPTIEVANPSELMVKLKELYD